MVDGDHLATKAFSARSRARVWTKSPGSVGADQVATYEPTVVADITYLRAGAMTRSSSGTATAAYLRDGLGLDGDTLVTLGRLLRREG